MTSPYRAPPPPKKRVRDIELEDFVDELENARVGAVVEHIRVALAGLVAAIGAGFVLLGSLEVHCDPLNSVILEFAVGMAGILGLTLAFYLTAIYGFHIAYRILGGRSIEWPRLRNVLKTAATLR